MWCYDRQENDWVDEWQRKRELPPSIILILTLEAEEEGEPDRDVAFQVDLPMAALSRATKRGKGSKSTPTGQQEQNAATQEASGQQQGGNRR